MREVYITRTAVLLPNTPVSNNEMEDYLGYINNKPSKAKKIVLRSNGIKQRYYAIDINGKTTHTNSQMTAEAVRNLFNNNSDELAKIELLSCGTSTPDQLIPSHGVMVHGWLPETQNIEVVSPSGVCCSGMHAFKYAYMSIKTGDKNNSVCTGSERTSKLLRAESFSKEIENLVQLEENPYIAFEKEFLRWMLSDGAGAFFLENKKNKDNLSLRIDWIEACSYANNHDTCMYMGADKLANGTMKSYMDFTPDELSSKSIFSLKQDTKMLSKNIVSLGFDHLKNILEKKKQSVEKIDYLLPHISSFFFEDRIDKTLEENGIAIPKSKWFTNLDKVGNIGSASIFSMVHELFKSEKLKKGQKILLVVPESSRFSYVYCLLTVC
jgi:3-oxoacyl-[acyl-carrier-protein] synthase-3